MLSTLSVFDHPTFVFALGLAAAGLGAWLAVWRRRYAILPARARAKTIVSGPLTYGSPNERREWFRRRGGRVKVRLANACVTEELGTAWVIDRSTGGLCMRVGRPLAEGMVLSVRPVHAPGRMPWAQVEVKSCRERLGDWEVGCQFVRRPSWNLMLHFG
jgi:hypothetical protein